MARMTSDAKTTVVKNRVVGIPPSFETLRTFAAPASTQYTSVSSTATAPGWLRLPPGSCGARLLSPAASTVSVMAWIEFNPFAPVAFTEKVAVPLDVGVPLMTPFEARDRPTGNDPEYKLQL